MNLNTDITKTRAVEELPFALSVPDVAAILNIGCASAYELVRCGRLRSLKIGRKIRIPREALTEFLGSSN